MTPVLRYLRADTTSLSRVPGIFIPIETPAVVLAAINHVQAEIGLQSPRQSTVH